MKELDGNQRIVLCPVDPTTLSVTLPPPGTDETIREMRTGSRALVQLVDRRDGAHDIDWTEVGRVFELVFDDGTQSPFSVLIYLRDFAGGKLSVKGMLQRVLVYAEGESTPRIEMPAATDIEVLPDGTLRSNSLEIYRSVLILPRS